MRGRIAKGGKAAKQARRKSAKSRVVMKQSVDRTIEPERSVSHIALVIPAGPKSFDCA